jgi:hypothetical protein
MSLEFLKHDRRVDPTIINAPGEHDEETFGRIRCPLCKWRPSPSSRWSCYVLGTPEPLFDWCGTVWNTFSTGGRCPGCRHQWRWTSCLRCQGWSLHIDWYDVGS